MEYVFWIRVVCKAKDQTKENNVALIPNMMYIASMPDDVEW